jgi:hypothetical protein
MRKGEGRAKGRERRRETYFWEQRRTYFFVLSIYK